MRPVRVVDADVMVTPGSAGTFYLRSRRPLGPYAGHIADRLEYWAQHPTASTRTFLAERSSDGRWRRVAYADALHVVRGLAQAFLDRGLSVERPILILSGNSIDHAMVALAAMYVGIPYAPIAPAYSLRATDLTTLRRIVDNVRPGLLFAADGASFDKALIQIVPGGPGNIDVVASNSMPTTIDATPLAVLQATTATDAVDAARSRVNPDTIAKILFTSGSTGKPKGVINTQRMLCSNQEMLRSMLPFLADQPPVLCDWLPWNHTAGGNHNFGIALDNGGTMYIDGGRPTPQQFAATLRNLREVPCTAHFQVPRFYEMLLPHLRSDAVLRETFFKELKLLFFAAAGLGQRFWDELREVSIAACGEELLIMSGFGSTETGPYAMSTGANGARAGVVGLPAPGLDLKLVPVGAKLEARMRGPNITPGYWGDEALTRAAFDAEGYCCLGDAMRFVDPTNPAKGLMFDGRLAEDFKLSTGTWVNVGPLRARIVAAAAGLAQDVVITGHNRDFAGALIFPNLAECRSAAGLPPTVPPTDTLKALARDSTGCSTFVARAILVEDPPSLDAGEITDKGSLNQSAVLQHRAALVEDLHAANPSPRVISCEVPIR
jgi:feruloyl-CoA synthase